MKRVEVFEDREAVQYEGSGESFEAHDELRLGEFDLREMPRAGEWLCLRAFGAAGFQEGYCFNVYKVREVWHQGIHTSWDSIVNQVSEQDRGPATKVYVTFSHTLDPGVHSGFICGRTPHALR